MACCRGSTSSCGDLQVSYQTQASSDYSSLEHQKDYAVLERCRLGVTRTQARLAAEAEAGARDAATLGIGAGKSGERRRRAAAIDLGALGTVEVGEAAGACSKRSSEGVRTRRPRWRR